jgi:hypothetical protein
VLTIRRDSLYEWIELSVFLAAAITELGIGANTYFLIALC